ncbi:Cytochrome c class I [Aphelenchoides besseyi]|nr:Cytochrome c class I [Aphelenchoides besseyi]
MAIKTGPPLKNIIRRKSGGLCFYTYLPAIKRKVILECHLGTKKLVRIPKDPKFFIPGTKMNFDGIEKEQERADVITYIAEQIIQLVNDRIEISTEVVEIKPWINGLKSRTAVAAALMVFVITYSEILPGQFSRKIVYVHY